MKKTKRTSICIATGLLFLGGMSQLRAQTWSTTGNAGTSSTTNFIGTTDGVAFKIRTDNQVRMTVTTTGFVGVGTSSAIGNAIFAASGNSSGWGGMYCNGAISTTRPFYGYSVANVPVAWQYYDPAKSALIFSVANGDRLTIANSGNVGIGTTAPTLKLDVIGDGRFSGYIDASSGYFGTVNATSGDFTNVYAGPFTINSSGLSGSPNFTISPNIIVNGDASFNGLFDAEHILGTTNNSAGGVTGTAIYNSPSLSSFGVFGSSNSSPFAFGVACYGNGYYTGNWYDVSDAQFKTNVVDVKSALGLITQLQPRKYTFKCDEYKSMNFPQGEQYGFIAQEIEKVIPNLVAETTRPVDLEKPDGETTTFKMVNYIGLIPVLTQAIQEQQTIIEGQDSIIQLQNDRLARLEIAVAQMSSGTADLKKENSNESIQLNRLYPNQPNPFSQETIIKYNISADAAGASIVIRDMQGIVQQTIILSQKREGSIVVSAENMITGLYTYELVIDGKVVDTKKMVIAK